MEIPIIDIFAGPGGLGEGFSSFIEPKFKKKVFNIALSIEKEKYAHQTLTLRSFYRQFNINKVPSEYYDFIKGKLSLDNLFEAYPIQAKNAKNEAWKAQLGENINATSNKEIDERISLALNGKKDWLLIGGPPCQAYSIVGRSRRKDKLLDEKKDIRVGLYKQYLRVLALHSPSVFVMENVKGLLSAKTKSNSVFENIINDLSNPAKAHDVKHGSKKVILKCPGYKIYSLVSKPRGFDKNNNPIFRPEDYLIYSEMYGIPQTRHRVILLGIRNDINFSEPKVLSKEKEVFVEQVLNGLPKLRSGLSKTNDTDVEWISTLNIINEITTLRRIDSEVWCEVKKSLQNIKVPTHGIGDEFIYDTITSKYKPDWYLNKKLLGISNHQSRGHMKSDLLRYLFVSCFGKVRGRSPKLEDFPEELLPAHKNVKLVIKEKKFTDRFRVQLSNAPAKTITSHISKDGHYFIHPDPLQCRSFTVREAARIQTFPDDYFFCGPRTAQFIQVGNAVPPLLANKIAKIVFEIFDEIVSNKSMHY